MHVTYERTNADTTASEPSKTKQLLTIQKKKNLFAQKNFSKR
jgi:hypothetical protein